MTFGAVVSALGMFGLVLGLLLLTLRVLRRFTINGPTTGARIPLEVVQRLAVGPRQGIAIVRIGDQLVAVSTGEGGVRRLHAIQHTVLVGDGGTPDESTPDATTVSTIAGDGSFAATFRHAVRSAIQTNFTGALGIALALAAASVTVPSTLAAQQKTTTAPTKTAPTKEAAQLPPTKEAATAPPTKEAAKAPAPAKTASPATAAPADIARADTMISRLAPKLDLSVGNERSGGLRLSGTVGVVVMLGLLTLIPTLVLMMTGFTRILIVLHFLRQAIGAQSAPPAQLVTALALLLTGFVMAPTLTEVNRTALEPWMDGKLEQTQMLSEGVKPFRAFMLRQTREKDLATFMNLSQQAPVARADDIPLSVLASAFVTSELRVSFQMGFALFLPFIVIDIVVASVLMSMGMMMVPPAMISLPFKLLLFVLVDGWTLIVQGLVQSFH